MYATLASRDVVSMTPLPVDVMFCLVYYFFILARLPEYFFFKHQC
jgi:hypothetical protein